MLCETKKKGHHLTCPPASLASSSLKQKSRGTHAMSFFMTSCVVIVTS
jgi:hypothetical protein